ncbi:MAG TPA: hypothetical protein VH856_03730 [Steroidobacteraceae bacterium]|jgi:hypothetical protein
MNVRPPNRVTHTYTQRLVAPPAGVFPLFCPVREADWIDGWNPPLVLSVSGLAEPDCVFVTDARPYDAIWYVTRHEPERGFVEMIKVTPEVTACKLTIQVRAAAGGSEADVTYSHTSLGPQGDVFLATFTAEFYVQFMREWEERMNYYLKHGKALRSGAKE